jgi:hypothetical protein
MADPVFHFIGGEDIDFSSGLAPTVSTTGERMRTAYSRCALYPPLNSWITSKQFTAITEGFIHAMSYCVTSDTYGGTPEAYIIGFSNSAYPTSGIFICLPQSVNGYISLVKISTAGVVTTLATSVLPWIVSNTVQQFDLELFDYGASGTLNLSIDGVLRLTYSGDISIAGISEFDVVSNKGFCDSNGHSRYAYISEICVSDSDTRGLLGVMTRVSIDVGDTNDMTGTYEAINEVSKSDADLLFTNTIDHDAQFALSAMPTGDYRILARRIAARAIKSHDSTPTKLKLGEKIDDGALDLDSGQSLAVYWDTYDRIINGIQSKTLANTIQIAMRAGE